MTRMINIMVQNNFLKRTVNDQDRRRYKIEITTKGKEILVDLPTIILNNRNKALEEITENELIQLENILNKIIFNCK